MHILTPWEHRRQIRHMCAIGQQPTGRQITRAYFRYAARAIRSAVAS